MPHLEHVPSTLLFLSTLLLQPSNLMLGCLLPLNRVLCLLNWEHCPLLQCLYLLLHVLLLHLWETVELFPLETVDDYIRKVVRLPFRRAPIVILPECHLDSPISICDDVILYFELITLQKKDLLVNFTSSCQHCLCFLASISNS